MADFRWQINRRINTTNLCSADISPGDEVFSTISSGSLPSGIVVAAATESGNRRANLTIRGGHNTIRFW